MFPGKNSRREMRRAADDVRIQTGQKERFRAGVTRSGTYMPEIKKILASYKLPEELAYLPHVESSFNTRAYSKFGAAGIWQFTRATGKQYLTIDYALDERLDPIAATHAAAKYLKNSYHTLGNWPLALTSYNYGLAGMRRAVAAKGSYEKIFQEYNQGHFKFASKNFYAEFLAALKVARRLERSKEVPIDPPLSCIYFRLPGFIPANVACNHFGISMNTLKKINPALRPTVISGEKYLPKGYFLRLPGTKKSKTLMASLSPSFFHDEQKPSRFHRVRKGDTAGTIARLHGVSLRKLMQANNLDKYATIYIHQKLRIPSNGKQSSGSDAPVIQIKARNKVRSNQLDADRQVPVLLASKKLRPSEIGIDFVPQKDPTVYNVFSLHKKNGVQFGYITVQPEESLPLYGEWLSVSTSHLRNLNKLDRDTPLSPGQQLLIPFDSVTPNLFEEKRLDFLKETEEDFFAAFSVVGRQVYRVAAGDTLWDICRNKFEIPLWLLERYNSTINLSRLTTNQELIIPIVQTM